MWLRVLTICCVAGITVADRNLIPNIQRPSKCPFSISSYLTAVSIQDESLHRNGLYKDILGRNSPIILGVSKMNTTAFEWMHTLIIEIRNYTQLVGFNYIW